MFVEKLNKKQEGNYVIQEEKIIDNGRWEGFLNHDNVSYKGISIYTEPNFEGEKVSNYLTSTPIETPWKTYMKVFSNSEKVYITYETTGDQVEAEDINLIQEAIVENNIDIEELQDRTDTLEEMKADKIYVNTELNKKYDKDKVYTKEEVLQKIEDLIGAAPEALDTLAEIADALNNDPNFAATITTMLSNKVEKIQGKGLSTEDYTSEEKSKLLQVEEGANKFIHPSTHNANMIVESTTKRFVSDTEKNRWDEVENKAGKIYVDETFATKEDIQGVGTGDMLKAIYDTDNSGKIDKAKDTEKLGGKSPSEYMKAGPLTCNDLKGV